MPDGMILGSQAATAPDRPGVLGYLYNRGGLNNQKMALISLMLTGLREKQAVNLPYIRNLDQRTELEYVVRIAEVFDLDRIFAFAGQHGLTVLADCPSGERGGWKYFESFHDWPKAAMDRRSLDTLLDAVASLRPRIASHPAFLQMRDFVRGTLGIDMVVQLRIEDDWREHAVNLRRILGDSDDSGIGFAAILSKVKNTFPDLRMAYVTADEKSMSASKNEIRSVCRSRFGIDLIWKSDLMPAALIEQLSPLEQSLIDYEMAKCSPRFVGLTSSTFANLMALEKFAITRRPVRGHYIYNCPGDVVQERHDNGYSASPHTAILPALPPELLAEYHG